MFCSEVVTDSAMIRRPPTAIRLTTEDILSYDDKKREQKEAQSHENEAKPVNKTDTKARIGVTSKK